MSTTGIIIGILVAAVLFVFAEMYRELHTFRVTRYRVASPKLTGEKTWVFLSDLHNQVYGENNCKLIDAVKNAELSALDKQKMAKNQADLIIENANKEAQSITKAKVKEAKAKADLRINFAKSSAEEASKKNIKKCEENIKKLKEKSEKMKAQTIKTVINLIVN